MWLLPYDYQIRLGHVLPTTMELLGIHLLCNFLCIIVWLLHKKILYHAMIKLDDLVHVFTVRELSLFYCLMFNIFTDWG